LASHWAEVKEGRGSHEESILLNVVEAVEKGTPVDENEWGRTHQLASGDGYWLLSTEYF
jgi:hypothetical protein